MKSLKSKFKRVRPLLGTFVEIRLSDASPARMNTSATRAFEAIGGIDRLMSFHRADSDLSRLNRATANEWISVDVHTRNVFAMSNKFFKTSNGIFDARCGAQSKLNAGIAPVEISGRRIRKTGADTFDLGGIAKGYAVDLAVKILKRAGIKSGLVNAGDDLRAFGPDEWPVAVRHPALPNVALTLFPMKNGALATSGSYFSRKRSDRKWNSALQRRSVTVVAPTCVVADGLTKVVALSPAIAASALRRFRSHAFFVGTNGVLTGVN